MSVDEAIASSLSEVGVLQKEVDNQHEYFNMPVEHKTVIASISSGKSNLESWISTAIEVSWWTVRKQQKQISPGGFEWLLGLSRLL